MRTIIALIVAVAGYAFAAELPLVEEAPEDARTVAFETDTFTWASLDVSPDGQTIVFEVLGDLYTVGIDGGRAVNLTQGMAFDSQPVFSPDGSRIAFISDRDGTENLWLIDRTGDNSVKLSEGGNRHEFASPTWAPDGSHVVVSQTTWGLRTFELWSYHVDGGSGLRITTAKPEPDTHRNQRANALGAVYSSDAKFLYYAAKRGGFGYNLTLPLWQVVRREMDTGMEDVLTNAVGSAFRPLLSPDGQWLVYGTRAGGKTGLRIRHLARGTDEWLIHPVEHDEQESRFTRDLLPGYAFMPEGDALVVPIDGKLQRVDLASGQMQPIAITVSVRQTIGPSLYAPYRIGVGPVKARLIRDAAVSPDGNMVAFSALMNVYTYDLSKGELNQVSPAEQSAFHPAWSPDGRRIAYVTWSSADGGHVWHIRSNGSGKPRQMSQYAAFYSDPVFTPDGETVVALRATTHERRYREYDYGQPVGSDIVLLGVNEARSQTVIPARGLMQPHFIEADDRLYLYDYNQGVISMRLDGSDRVAHLAVKGPGIYGAEEPVGAQDIRISPNGRMALAQLANQLYVVKLGNRHARNVSVDITMPSLPIARITDIGADDFGWVNDDMVHWTTGDRFHRLPMGAIEFGKDAGDATDEDEEDSGAENGAEAADMAEGEEAAEDAQEQSEALAGNGAGNEAEDEAEDEPEPLKEDHEAIQSITIDVYQPRSVPAGTVALVNATVLTMEAEQSPIENGIIMVQGDRIVYVGKTRSAVPEGTPTLDMNGKIIVPGYIDTHAHFRPLRRVLDTSNWAFLANLAYGVTTGLDVQPSTIDILAYEDLVDAGAMIGPRALSTGPGIFNNNEFRSREHARAVLSRYKEHYHVRNLKSYIAGSRKQRHWVVQAARELDLMPTAEGALDMKLDITHMIDGFAGNEHNLPLLTLYRDVVELAASTRIAYTPTLLVSYGGPWGENYFYTRESPLMDAKLNRFMPRQVIEARASRSPWAHESEHVHQRIAEQALKIVRRGGRVGVGAHGQLQGLGYHWELWALASGGFTPMEALRAATRHGAEMIGIIEDVGTIADGKLADLVVLNSNPLDDIRATNDIAYVMKGGFLYEADTLDQEWPEQKPLPDQWWWHTTPKAPVPAPEDEGQ